MRSVDKPEIIGPGWWKALNVLAIVTDTSKLKNSKEFFSEYVISGIGQYFDCLHCRAHAFEYATRLSPPLKFGKTMLEWTHIFHDKVNERLKKPKGPSFKELLEHYEWLRLGGGCDNCGGIPTERPPQPPALEPRRQILD